jgi:hypothetical protein
MFATASSSLTWGFSLHERRAFHESRTTSHLRPKNAPSSIQISKNPNIQKKCVISTEAAHSFIVSSAAERPPHFAFAVASLVVAFAFALAFAVTSTCRHPDPERSRRGRIPKRPPGNNPSDLSNPHLSSRCFVFAFGIKRGASAPRKAHPKKGASAPGLPSPPPTLDTPATIKSGRNQSPAQAGLSTLAP